MSATLSLVKDVISKLNDQGDLITNLIDKISELVDPKDALDLKNNLEAEMKERSDAFKKELDDKNDAFEKQMQLKVEELEKSCDEARQRGLKGNLIVSSPERNSRNGQVHTWAVKENVWDNIRTCQREETDLELAVRMVGMKTGVYIPHKDVYACHSIGKKENHSYIICVGNRQPYSAWDNLTYGMRTGKTFTNANIFINYQLTAKRIELSKEVRQAKKDNLIQKSPLMQTVKFILKSWVKKLSRKLLLSQTCNWLSAVFNLIPFSM